MQTINEAMTFVVFELSGDDAQTFLQSQITADIKKIDGAFQATAICNLKGRIDFGIWLAKKDAAFLMVISADCADDFSQHIKKYGAFSKIQLTTAQPIFGMLDKQQATFSLKDEGVDIKHWLLASMAQGQYVITQKTRGLFQPQALRLHQQGGVHYDKGCYLGQEVVARLWFKASPKAWLHRVLIPAEIFSDIQTENTLKIVNAVAIDDEASNEAKKYEALVVARPEQLPDTISILTLPTGLDAGVART